jgi:arylsulfatase A-like enzyme/Flp pilus assembly protein TadD
LGFLCLVASASATAAAPPNVILITLDTVRADRMGFLGSKGGLTPNLDRLASQSAIFTHAYSQAPLTPVSHATILTGTYPQFHKVNDFKVPLAKDLPYAPDILRNNGYRTAAFVGSSVLDPKQPFAQGFGRGFDTYDAPFTGWRPGLDRYHTTERRAADVVAHALAWLDTRPQGQGQRPFFMWVHLYDPHHPYEPPEPYKTKYAATPYDGEIAYTDSAVGELLNQLRARGLYDGTLIAVMADHGEALGDHGEDQHGIFLYDETIHVPLLIKLPQDASSAKSSVGLRIESRVELVDVLPTILQAVGIAIPKQVQGQSLLELIATQTKLMPSSAKNDAAQSVLPQFRDRPAYAETDYPHTAYGWSSLRALRTEKYLYIKAPRPELYGRGADPNATKNLFSTSSAVGATLASQLDVFRQKTSSAREAPQHDLDPQAQQELEALGYISGSHDAKAGASSKDKDKKLADPPADPKDKIEIANRLAETTFLTNNLRFQEAIPLLEKLVVEEPDMPMPFGQLGRSYVSVKEYAKAVLVLRRFVELDPDSDAANSHFELGVALLASGDAAAAIPEFKIVVNKARQWDLPRLQLADAYAQSNRLQEAIAECEIVAQTNPNNYEALLLEGRLLVKAKQPEVALPRLEKAALLQPKRPEPRAYLADAFEQLGRKTESERERAAAHHLEANAPE